MINKMVTYKIREDKLNVVKRAITEFIDAVRGNEPGTIIYEAYQKENDYLSFVHFMSFEDEKAEEIHRTTSHVNKFVNILYPICEEKPLFTDLNLVHSTRSS